MRVLVCEIFENLTQKELLDAKAELYRKRDWLCQSVY